MGSSFHFTLKITSFPFDDAKHLPSYYATISTPSTISAANICNLTSGAREARLHQFVLQEIQDDLLVLASDTLATLSATKSHFWWHSALKSAVSPPMMPFLEPI
jgi:hypothetical protein